jgi:hypothetical protein
MDNRQHQDRYDQGYQAGWNQQNQQREQWRDKPDYESDAYVNRNDSPNPGYGEVYHGNLKQREEETNRARGRNYGNMNRDAYSGNRQNWNVGGYGQVGYTGGGHSAWESHGAGNQDMGGNYQPYENRYDQRMGASGYGSGRSQRTSGSDQQYGSSNYGYGRERRHDDGDNNWWDRTKEKVSSWFSDDDDDDRRRNYRSDNRQGSQQYASGMSSAGSSFRPTGEHRGKGPKGYQRSDDRIREDVCDRLYEDGHVDASDIDVKVEGSEVVLSGSVRSREEKRRAEDVVENIMGVRHVENRIRVNNESNWRDSENRYGYNSRTGDYDRSGNSGNLENRSYTGNSGDGTGIGNESGTTNEIIRNAGNLDTNK